MIANTAVANLSGTNTGDESTTSIKSKLDITTLTGSNTGDQVLPTLASIGGVANNSAINGATKTKITYDAKGLVTAGIDATTADIAASTNKNYVTDVQAGVLSNTSGTNTGDETTTSLNTKLGITTLTGSNTGDETITSLNTKLGITTLTGSNTGDQVLPTLASIGGVANNSAINGATKTKITYDEKGLVTSGTDATTADIAASSNKNYVTDVQAGVISNTSGTNTGDETITSLSTKLGITTLTGSNTGDENATTIKTKLGITTLTGSNTGDESATTIKTKLGITTLTGSNTGDETLTSLINLGVSPKEGSTSLITTGLLTSLTLSSNDSEKQTEDIDLTKTIHKLTGKDLTNYLLRDGFEGQVIYILPFGDDTNLSNIKIIVLNGTYWKSSKLTTSDEIRSLIWTPFSSCTPANTIATAIFTEKKWFLTGGTSAIQR
jgi:hypothetical protein